MTQAANDALPAIPLKTDQDKRDDLRARIEAGQLRNEERTVGDYAREAAQQATDFAKQHPVATVAGAVALGLIVGAMTRPGRRLTRRGGAMAALATDAAIAYGLRMFDNAGVAARHAGDRLADAGDAIGSQARHLQRDARYQAEEASDVVRAASRKLARKSERTIHDLRSRLSRK